MFSYLHDVLSVGMTTTMTMAVLRDMTKGVTTVSLIMALMVTMLSKETWRIIMSGTEGEMNCQKVCVYEFGSGEGEAHM